MEYITASCVIRGNTVYLNGQVLFERGQAVLPDFLLSVYYHFGFRYPKFYKMDHLGKLGWLACELLLKDDFDPAAYAAEEMAVVLANSNASLDTDYKYLATVKEIPSPAVFVYTLPNIVIGEICIRNKWKGENAFFIFESFDAGFIEQYVRGLLENKDARGCVCGWVDVLGEDYMAALYLVEQRVGPPAQSPRRFPRQPAAMLAEHPPEPYPLPLTAETMNSIFHQNTRHA